MYLLVLIFVILATIFCCVHAVALQVATLTEQLATAKASTAAAEEKVLAVAAAAAQLAVEEQEKAEQRMSELKSATKAGVKGAPRNEGYENEPGEEHDQEDRPRKSKQKQMTLDSMLPKHAARARQLEEAAANLVEEVDEVPTTSIAQVAPAATVGKSRDEQGEKEDDDWCGLPPHAAPVPISASCGCRHQCELACRGLT